MSDIYLKKGGYSRLWEKRSPILNSIDIELTERCNNTCIHCYINLPENDIKAKNRELTTRQWKDIITRIADLGGLEIRFTGGEPLLRPDFSELYLFTRKLGIKVMIFTNSTLITEKVADMFQKIPPLKDIEITVYGMEKESYEKVTGNPGSFKKFRNGIQLLRERKISFIVKYAILPPNRDEIDEFKKWASEITSMENIASFSMFYDLRGRRDSEKKNKTISGLRLSPEEGLKILTSDKKKYDKEMKKFIKNFLRKPDTKLFNCGAGIGGAIDAYGIYQPCLLLRHPDVTYDLKKITLENILTIKMPGLKKMEAKDPDYLYKCAKCFLKGLCEQCPAKSWSEHGTLDTPVEHLCNEAHQQARYLGLLKENEFSWEVDDWEDRIKKLK